jgi:hypothetical protein
MKKWLYSWMRTIKYWKEYETSRRLLVEWLQLDTVVAATTPNIHGLCMEVVLPMSPWRKKRTNGIVIVLFHDSFELRLFSGLVLTYCTLALSRNNLASLVDICLCLTKGAHTYRLRCQVEAWLFS